MEACLKGGCVASAKLDCNDDNACTSDKCNALSGCVNLALGASATCDDGDACTVDDFCLQGDCQGGTNTCQCKTQKDCGKFEDGDACNGTLYCDKAAGPPYSCKVNPATIVACSPAKDSDCQTNTCLPSTGACQLVTAGENTTCEDGDTCTAGDYCEKGICHPGTATCNCKNDADCAASEDENVCNGRLFCNKAKSQCQLNPVTVVTCKTVFDDSCRANLCNPKLGTCHLLPIQQGKVCDDGNACTPNKTCLDGACTTNTNTCACTKDADCAAKENGNLCDGTLYCDVKNNQCVVNPATIVRCDTSDDPACLHDLCSPKSGLCEAVALPKDGTACDDQNPCTPVSTCKGGGCIATANTCECKANADCAVKEDGNLCNGTLYCDLVAGKCVVNPATVVKCPDAFDETCLENQCDPKTVGCGMQPAHQGNQCDGDSICTAGGWCKLGVCDTTGVSVCACQADADCGKFEDGNPCNGTLYCDKKGKSPICAINPATIVTCQSADDTACLKSQCSAASGKCAPTPIAGPCNDGDPCSAVDLCAAGACKGGVPLVCNDGNA